MEEHPLLHHHNQPKPTMSTRESDPNPDPAYTVFIRLPFPRVDFVDPPDV